MKGNADLKRALDPERRWPVGDVQRRRGVVAASVFYKSFDQPIERIVIAPANPIVTFQNSDHARNFGFELEAGQPLGRTSS